MTTFGGVTPTLEPHAFHTLYPSTMEYNVGMWNYMIEKYPGVKTVFIVNADDVQGHVAATVSEAMAEYHGLELVASSEFFSYGTMDFTAIATKIVSLQPDVLDLGACWDAFAGLILSSVAEIGGFQGQVILNQWGGEMIIWAGFEDPALVEGIIGIKHDYGTHEVSRELYPSAIREVAEEYIARYGVLDMWCASYSDNNWFIKSAIEGAGSLDRYDIYEYLTSPGAEINSLFGTFGFHGSEHWAYGRDYILKVPIPVSECSGGIDYTVRLIPADEYAQFWPLLTKERLPELAAEAP